MNASSLDQPISLLTSPVLESKTSVSPGVTGAMSLALGLVFNPRRILEILSSTLLFGQSLEERVMVLQTPPLFDTILSVVMRMLQSLLRRLVRIFFSFILCENVHLFTLLCCFMIIRHMVPDLLRGFGDQR